MSLGKSAAFSSSRKENVNTRSFTEAELVAVDDVVSQIIWTRNFIQAQRYNVGASTLYRDNQSAILLEGNGTVSPSKRTKHLNVKYFFVKDRIHLRK